MSDESTYQLGDVFNEASFPNVTFTKPEEYPHIKASFSSPGKHITISGPSGTGKTTVVKKILDDISVEENDILWINGRKHAEIESGVQLFAQELKTSPDIEDVSSLLKLVDYVIIDDFHFVGKGARLDIASRLKLWHEKGIRFVIVGIASSHEELYGADPELGIRNDPYEMTTQSSTFYKSVIRKGEDALNVNFSNDLIEQIVYASNKVPSIIHVIARVCCINKEIHETQFYEEEIDLDLKHIREDVLRIFHAKYRSKVVGLAKGKQQARSVHNTYFDIVKNIAKMDSSEIPKEHLYNEIVGKISDSDKKSRKAASFYNCINNLSDVIDQKGLSDTLFFRKGGEYISIEDLTFRFYLNLLDIEDIRSRIQLRSSEYAYDVSVSFAGEDRGLVEKFVGFLKDRGISVFYDFDRQAQLWGKDIRQTLADVYAEDAKYMVVFLSENYPATDWANFELSVGREASDKRTEEYLLPIRIDDVNVVGVKSTTGYIDIRDTGIEDAADLLAEKIENQ
jgi:hypothetical protein